MRPKINASQKYWGHAFASGGVFPKPPKRRIWNFLFFLFEKLRSEYHLGRVWKSFEDNAIIDENLRLSPNAAMVNKNKKEAVKIGKNVICRGIIRIEKNGSLEIGDDVYIGDDVIISAQDQIIIGKGTLLANGVQVFDNTSHPIDWQERSDHFKMIAGLITKKKITVPAIRVKIGNYCWLCANSMVLKGVNVGDHSIIGAGCVITKDVPPDVMVGGIEQKIVKKL